MADILIIEDEANIAAALGFLLMKEGHRHTHLASGAGAIDAIRTTPPDLVLLDVMLPDVSGYQILQDLRADPDLRRLPVLMMTARGASVERQKAAALGADGFIAKPFALSELRTELARLLEGGC